MISYNEAIKNRRLDSYSLYAKEVNKMSEIEVKQSIALEDGMYEGQIERVEERTTPQGYEYIDIFVKLNEYEVSLKYGCPKSGSTDGKLMKTMSKFTEVKVGMKLDPEKVLTGKDVVIVTEKEKKGDKEYTQIISLKPKKVVTEAVE